MKERLIVSLDLNDLGKIKELVKGLNGLVEIYKVGSIPFIYFGKEIIEFLKQNRKKVMLDLKFHDIPNTVARACEGVVELGIDFLTLHTSGGFSMLEEAVKTTLLSAQKKKLNQPKLLGVTVLTSIDEAYFKDLFGEIKRSVTEQVIFLAQLARSAGLDGVVASPREVEIIRKECGTDFLIVTPGIRPKPSQDDQARTMTPGQAIRAGADYIVVGRPIIKAEDPVTAAKEIIQEMGNGD